MANYFLNKRAVLFLWCMALSVYAYTEIPAAQNAPLPQEQTQTEMTAAVSQAQAPVQGILSITDCKALEEQYYRMQSFDPQLLLDSFDRIREALNTSFEDAELLNLYFEHAKLISMLYVYEGNRQCGKYDTLIQGEAQDFLRQAEKLTGKHAGFTRYQMSDLAMRYANYLYTKIGVPKNTFAIASAVPVLYRKALMLNPGNIEAAAKLACWHIFPADVTTGNYNSYIESQEEYIEELSAADRFNAYLLYSIYSMKKYESTKGRAYLQKAASLFPNHVLLLRVYENYRKGIFSL